jgi:hypothetical protein
MTNCVIIGKRLIPLDQIALVEPFDPATAPRIQSDRAFQARVVLTDRQSILTEAAAIAYVRTHGFRMLQEDGIAVNSTLKFSVETFEPREGFQPSKPYKSRLLWRDGDDTHSKLLLTAPEIALAIAVEGEVAAEEPEGADEKAPKQPPRGARRRQRPTASSLRPAS